MDALVRDATLSKMHLPALTKKSTLKEKNLPMKRKILFFKNISLFRRGLVSKKSNSNSKICLPLKNGRKTIKCMYSPYWDLDMLCQIFAECPGTVCRTHWLHSENNPRVIAFWSRECNIKHRYIGKSLKPSEQPEYRVNAIDIITDS